MREDKEQKRSNYWVLEHSGFQRALERKTSKGDKERVIHKVRGKQESMGSGNIYLFIYLFNFILFLNFT